MNLVWYRNDLRSTDNQSLAKAIQADGDLLAIYCFDPNHYKKNVYGFKKTEKYRAQFLIESINELYQSLQKIGIPLIIKHEYPEKELPDLIKKHSIKRIFLQKEWTQEEQETLNRVKNKLTEKVEIIESYDQFLFHPDDIPYNSINDIPQVFTEFRKKCEKQSKVRTPVQLNTTAINSNKSKYKSKIPTLNELGLHEYEIDNRTAFPFKGGEHQAFTRINEYFWKTKNLSSYKKTRNGLIGKSYSSKLSAWLANGSISPRQVYWEVKKYEDKIGKNQDTYWLIFELIWRDFFKYISLKYGSSIFKKNGIQDKNYTWGADNEVFKNWSQGRTEYDFVNANMIELAKTGFMSNRGRQNVASYWSKECKQDWRIGAAYFESLLIDYDVHSNYGNWMYTSGVGNDPRDRKFNIHSQTERYDSNAKYRNLWLQPNLFD